MSKHEIEVEGLPEGWEPVEVRIDPDQHNKYVGDDGCLYCGAKVRLKKKQPRRIAFEETDYANVCDLKEDVKWTFFDGKYWREVKETEEPALCLSVEECENILIISVLPIRVEEKIKTFLRNKNKTS